MTADTIADCEVKLNVVSDASGRMRVQASGFRFDSIRAVAIEDTVAKVAGVCAVYAYPRTASVVILYSPESCDTTAVLTAIADAQHIPAASVPVRAPHSADARNASAVRKIFDGFRRLFIGSPDGDPPTNTGATCGSGPASCG